MSRLSNAAWLIVLCIIATPFLPAQSGSGSSSGPDEDRIAWLLMARGRSQFYHGQLNRAMESFLAASEGNSLFPEAQYWIGRIYETEGEDLLAIRQYQLAIQNARFLYNLNQIYEIKYKLIGLYEKTGEDVLYEQMLRELVQEEHFPDEQWINAENNMIEMLKNDGLATLLYYFRQKLTFSAPATHALGYFYYNRGQYASALTNNMYAVLSVLSEGVEYLRADGSGFTFPLTLDDLYEWDSDYLPLRLDEDLKQYGHSLGLTYDLESLTINNGQVAYEQGLELMGDFDPGYTLNGIDYLLDQLEAADDFRPLIAENRLYRSLYYLACSLSAQGYDDQAGDIWRTLRYRTAAGEWQRRAQLQQTNPFIDDSGY